MTKKYKRTKRVEILMNEIEYKRLQELSDAQQLNVAETVRWLVEKERRGGDMLQYINGKIKRV